MTTEDEYKAASIAKADLTVEQHEKLRAAEQRIRELEGALRFIREKDDGGWWTDLIDAALNPPEESDFSSPGSLGPGDPGPIG